LIVSLAIGAVILVPSLAFLFTLVLRGRFDEARASTPAEAEPTGKRVSGRLLPAAGICLAAGTAATLLVESRWGRIVRVPLLLAFVVLAFLAVVPALFTVAQRGDEQVG